MRRITPTLTDPIKAHVHDQDVTKATALPVSNYQELMQLVAHLAYNNMDHLLFFRGQSRDYQNKVGASTIYPSIYRGERLTREQIDLSFDILTSASKRLCDTTKQAASIDQLRSVPPEDQQAGIRNPSEDPRGRSIDAA